MAKPKRLTWKGSARRRAAIQRAADEGRCAEALRAWKKLPNEIRYDERAYSIKAHINKCSRGGRWI